MNPLTIVVAAVVVLAIAVLVSYNRFVSQRQYLENSWSNIDTELRRRYDLIPNLVETVKGYATHERATLEAVIAARFRAAAPHSGAAEQAADENVLVAGLRQLLAVVERYPELQANTHFLDLQRQLVITEDRIQAARRLYNSNVRDYNRRVESVPSNLVASSFGFARADYFEVEPAVRAAPPPEVELR